MGKAPDLIKNLVDRFNQQSDQVRSPDYNETLIRIDFINPMMSELGWDIDNHQGFAEQYREVVHEDRVKVAGQTKAPDYSFRIGGARKFFLEAKKPAVNIKENWEPAYQLRRYAWSAKLACSLLTDFEEFAVYDTRIQPKQLEKASTARREFIKYTDYLTRWDFISGTFSKDAVLKGEFDRYCDSKKGRGAQEFDDAFLGEIEEWRKDLASNLALRNDSIDEAALNFSVQRIIDRIIFLRMAEDRGTETTGQLQALLNGDHAYDRLKKLFHDADVRYNSGLFHFVKEKDRDESPDTFTPGLDIDDKTLKDIIRKLYYPQSPYEFTMVSADILGSVYERFLGKVITLTAGHRAKIEEKPEVRKAGGVYYTPTYIVDYIVKNTVGKLLGTADSPLPLPPGEGRGEGVSFGEDVSQSRIPSPQPSPGGRGGKTLTPKEAAKLKVLDPACGSGSFLIGAYQFLLDWYLHEYSATDPASLATGKKAVLRQGLAGGWALTIAERKRILLDHIHGVDLDDQAVEVTKLNLLLKCLEGETSQTLGFEQKLFRERALPDLGKNILCGNSLIGTDIVGTEAWKAMSEEERGKINPFDYERAFPSVFKQGAFDAVIGNPPWGAELTDHDLEYVRERHREIIVRMIDSFMFFVDRAFDLIRANGFLGMIVPDVLLYQLDNENLRKRLLADSQVRNLLNLGDVFDQVTRPAAIVIAQCGKSSTEPVEAISVVDLENNEKRRTIAVPGSFTKVDVNLYRSLPGFIFVTDRITQYAIYTRLQATKVEPLATLLSDDGMQRGVSPDFKDAFVLTNADAISAKLETEMLRPVVTGGHHVRRFAITDPGLVLIYTSRGDDFEKLPDICRYIDRFRANITCKEVKLGKHPIYALHRPRDPKIFQKPTKLFGVITSDRLIIARDTEQLFATDGLFVFSTADPTMTDIVMGILNSKFATFLYRLISFELGRVLAQVKPAIVQQLPIPVGIPQAPRDRLAALVDSMLSLHKRLAAEQLPQRREQIQREIDATDRQIDQLVYQLYGLTGDEIRIVEAATS